MSTTKPIEKLTAAEAEKELAKVEKRIAELNAEIAEIKPPPPAPPAPAGAPGAFRDFDPLAGAGPEYRRVVLEGTPAELVELQRRHQELEAEAVQLAHRRHALQRRLATARDEEARAEAPRELERLAAEFEGVVSRAEKALEEAKAALDACSAWVSRVERQQDLAGARGNMLSAEQFRRLGIVLRHRIIEETEHVLEHYGGMYGNTVRRPALFRSRAEAVRLAKRLLPEPNPGLIERVRRKLRAVTTLTAADSYRQTEPSQHAIEADLEEWHRTRLDLIASGALEEAERLEPTKPGAKDRFKAA